MGLFERLLAFLHGFFWGLFGQNFADDETLANLGKDEDEAELANATRGIPFNWHSRGMCPAPQCVCAQPKCTVRKYVQRRTVRGLQWRFTDAWSREAELREYKELGLCCVQANIKLKLGDLCTFPIMMIIDHPTEEDEKINHEECALIYNDKHENHALEHYDDDDDDLKINEATMPIM